MTNVGRPRGRPSKKTLQVQFENKSPHKIEKEIHNKIDQSEKFAIFDECDVTLSRDSVLNRFIYNDTYMRYLTMNFVHTSKIKPPNLFPNVKKDRVLNLMEIDTDLISFKDINTMQLQLDKFSMDVEQKKNEIQNLKNEMNISPNYFFEKEKCEFLAELQKNIFNNGEICETEKLIESINNKT